MADIPSLVDQVKSEEDMLNLSQDDLLSYYVAVSSLAKQSLSSVNGLDDEILFYDAGVRRAESTIIGLDVEIFANSGNLTFLREEETRLIGESTITNEQIISTMTEIHFLDSTIQGCDVQLSSLGDEYTLLNDSILSSMEGFVKEAKLYSSLYTVYEQKQSEYQQLLLDISGTSSIYESARRTANYSYDNWLKAYSTLSGEQSTLSFLESEEIRLDADRILAEIDLDEAKRIYISTNESVKSISSMYEVALITRDYIRYLSSEAEAVDALSQATELYTQALAQYQASPTTENLSLLSNAESVKNAMYTKRQVFLKQSGGGVDYSTILGNVGTIAYETLLRGYDAQIAFEQSTIEHYTVLSNYAMNVLEPMYAEQRDSSLSNEQMFLMESTFWGEAYVSSVIGYNFFIQEEKRLTDEIISQSNLVIKLEEEIEGTDRVKRRILEGRSYTRSIIDYQLAGPQQGGASGADENVDDYFFPGRIFYPFIEKGLHDEVEELTSSFIAYSTISSINTQLAMESDSIIAMYTQQYQSIGDAIFLLEKDQDQTTSSIQGYRRESTITINQINYLTINMNKQDIDMFIAFNDIERAAFQYRESYIRKIRVDKQNDYEDMVKAVVSAASNQAIQTGTSNFMDLVNLDTPEIRAAYSAFSNLTILLSNFDTLDGNYNTRGQRLSNLSVEYGLYVTLNGELVSALSRLAFDPDDSNAAIEVTNKRAQVAAKQDVYTAISNDVTQITTTLNTQKQGIMTSFNTYFQPFALEEITNSISSFIRAGISDGYAAASLAI